VRFPLGPEQREAIVSGSPIATGTDHAACAVVVSLDEDQRRAITEAL
jgi:hypothetical protein